MQLNVGTVIK